MGVGLVCFQSRLFALEILMPSCGSSVGVLELCTALAYLIWVQMAVLGAQSGTPCTVCHHSLFFFFHSLLNLFFKYFSLFGCAGPCCGLQDLQSSWRQVGSLVAARELLVVVDQIWFLDQGLNLGPLHWEHRVLATWPPGESWAPFVCQMAFWRAYSSL